MTKIFYGPSNSIKPLLDTLAGTTGDLGELSNYILEPTPYFNIRTNYNYAGDNIIGYNYTLDFEGTVVPTGTENPRSLEANMEYLSKNREILNYYGGTLYLTDDEFNTLFKAKGGRLENINYNNSQNNWAASIPYTASLEFQEIVMGTESLTCEDPIIDPSSIIVNLADLTKYKIKSFNDSWNFNFNDDIYTDIVYLDDGTTQLATDNLSFEVSYNIQAVGRNYFIEQEDGTDTMAEPWENAKLFCQDRLHKQVSSLVDQVLNITAPVNCESDTQQSELFPLPADSGLLFNVPPDNFQIYNESITCNSSESNGSFSATYNAIVKRGASQARHTFEKSVQDQIQSNNVIPTRVIEIQGNIEGLVPGGLINSTLGNFELPANGYLILEKASPAYTYNPKYDQAANFGLFYFNPNEVDLSDDYKVLLNITSEALIGSNEVLCSPTAVPTASNFSINKNIFEGTISYNASYNSNKLIGGNYSNLTVDVERGSPVIASFVFPNGRDITEQNPLGIGTVLQDLGTKGKDVMTISITGRDAKLCCNIDGPYLQNYLNSANFDFTMPSGLTLPDDNNSILTDKSKNININTGEYTVKLTYVLCTDGCFI